MLRRFLLLQQLRDKTMKAYTAIIAGQMHGRSRCFKVCHAGSQFRRANSVEQRNPLCYPVCRLPAVATLAEQFTP